MLKRGSDLDLTLCKLQISLNTLLPQVSWSKVPMKLVQLLVGVDDVEAIASPHGHAPTLIWGGVEVP